MKSTGSIIIRRILRVALLLVFLVSTTAWRDTQPEEDNTRAGEYATKVKKSYRGETSILQRGGGFGSRHLQTTAAATAKGGKGKGGPAPTCSPTRLVSGPTMTTTGKGSKKSCKTPTPTAQPTAFPTCSPTQVPTGAPTTLTGDIGKGKGKGGKGGKGKGGKKWNKKNKKWNKNKKNKKWNKNKKNKKKRAVMNRVTTKPSKKSKGGFSCKAKRRCSSSSKGKGKGSSTTGKGKGSSGKGTSKGGKGGKGSKSAVCDDGVILPTCDIGFELIGNICSPIVCPTGFELIGNDCVAIVCETGFELIGNDCVAIVCETGFELIGNDCVIDCPTGFELIGDDCVAIVCDIGFELIGDDCVAIICDTGFELIGNDCEDIDECLLDACGTNEICTNSVGSFFCVCEGDFSFVNEICIRNGCFTSGATVDYAAIDAFCSTNNCCVDSGGTVGRGACDNWNLNNQYTICPGACQSDGACFDLGQTSPDGSEVVIGLDSCTGLFACATRTQATLIDIGDNACKGEESCGFLGDEAASQVIIGEGACAEFDYACASLGLLTTGIINIGAGSCTGDEACDELGGETTGDITIGSMSCAADSACNGLGTFASSILIGTETCPAANSCEDCQNAVTGAIDIGSNIPTCPVVTTTRNENGVINSKIPPFYREKRRGIHNGTS